MQIRREISTETTPQIDELLEWLQSFGEPDEQTGLTPHHRDPRDFVTSANDDDILDALVNYGESLDRMRMKRQPYQPPSDEEYTRRQNERFDRAINNPDRFHVENVPLSTMLRYKEFSRRPNEEHGSDPEYYERLKNHIQQHGMGDPIILEYSPDSGHGYIGEGNHRLAIAEDLGFTHVPVKVMSRGDMTGHPTQPVTAPGEFINNHNYFPSSCPPSYIGLPVQE